MINTKHIVQFSGGKDSTAMLLMMLEQGMPIDDIIFCDTTMEFPGMYDHIAKVERYIGRKVTRLRPPHDFIYYFAQYRKTRGKNKGECGYGWPRMWIRWCTRLFKIDLTAKYYPDLWQKLIAMDAMREYKFSPRFSVQDLEKRFALEDQQQSLFKRGLP